MTQAAAWLPAWGERLSLNYFLGFTPYLTFTSVLCLEKEGRKISTLSCWRGVQSFSAQFYKLSTITMSIVEPLNWANTVSQLQLLCSNRIVIPRWGFFSLTLSSKRQNHCCLIKINAQDYGLNVDFFPTNFYVEALTPKMVVFKGWIFGK
jgi:hypothetical protein